MKASSIAHAGISWKKLWPIEVSLDIHWTFSRFKVRSLRRDDLMATDMGKLQKRKNIIWLIIWKRDASRKDSQGSMIVSCEILIFANVSSNMIEMTMFVSNGTILQNKIFTYRMSESAYFHFTQNWWIPLKKSGNTGGPLRKRSDFDQALSTLNRLRRESGGRQLRTMPYWKYQQRQSSSSSSSTWWQWSGSWWSS